MESKTILLAHGFLGFGRIPGLPPLVNYFNGVAAHLERQGHTVIVPQVSPLGSISKRSAKLSAEIIRRTTREQGIHVIAHSMGGLDARHAISRNREVAARVRTLVTIGTPHNGSPVADALLDPFRPFVSLLRTLPQPTMLVQMLGNDTGGLLDLTTEEAVRFNMANPDVAGVRYLEIAGDASKAGHELLLFRLAAAIGGLAAETETNDGVVTKSSALRGKRQLFDDWPVDHAGEIGWSIQPHAPFQLDSHLDLVPFAPLEDHLARYDAIVKIL